MITKKEMLLSFIIFLSPNGNLNNDMATIIIVGQFCVIISKSTYY